MQSPLKKKKHIVHISAGVLILIYIYIYRVVEIFLDRLKKKKRKERRKEGKIKKMIDRR